MFSLGEMVFVVGISLITFFITAHTAVSLATAIKHFFERESF